MHSPILRREVSDGVAPNGIDSRRRTGLSGGNPYSNAKSPIKPRTLTANGPRWHRVSVSLTQPLTNGQARSQLLLTEFSREALTLKFQFLSVRVISEAF